LLVRQWALERQWPQERQAAAAGEKEQPGQQRQLRVHALRLRVQVADLI
jgi:hypothetical protein